MVAVSAALAAFLLARGDYVIGGLIATLVVFRAVFLIGTSRARRAFRGPGVAGGPAQRAGQSGSARQVLRGLSRGEFKVAASVIGLDASQMQRGFNEGRSIAELAGANGVPLDRVVSAMVADATSQLDIQVAQGILDPQTAKRAKARLTFWANRLVNFHKGDLAGLRNGARS
jgi:hypothetical protein